jgi:AcrR family transcriptional regulator
MATTDFQRARSDEQRAVRRQAILAVARDMVAEMPVADISLNELSRRVGLAKSNVLRYFDSREAILLELLDDAGRAWLGRLAGELPPRPRGSAAARAARLAVTIATSLVADRPFCELISVSAAVLERNVSPDVARRYKVATMANVAIFAGLIRGQLPELSEERARFFAAATMVSVTGVWPLAQPSAAMLRVYEDPAMAALRLDAGTALTAGEAAPSTKDPGQV